MAILSTNCREFVAAYFGAAKAGMVALPVNLLSGPENIVHALVDSGTRVLVVHSDLAELALGATAAVPAIDNVVVIGGVPDGLEAAPNGPTLLDWDDLLSSDDTNPDTVIADRQIVQCLYSSGTTSRPKGVLTSHLAVTMAGLSNGAIFGMGWGATGSITVLPLPLFHTAGLNGVLRRITMGATIHLLAGFDPVQYADTVAVRATHLVGLPLMLEALADGKDRGLDLSSIEMLLYAMAPMSAEMRPGSKPHYRCEDRPRLGHERVHPGHRHAVARAQPRQNPTPGGTRPPWPRTASASPAGGSQGMSTPTANSPTAAPPSWRATGTTPEANAEVFIGGHMHSGDLGRIDPEGVVWFSDRVKGHRQVRRRERQFAPRRARPHGPPAPRRGRLHRPSRRHVGRAGRGGGRPHRGGPGRTS